MKAWIKENWGNCLFMAFLCGIGYLFAGWLGFALPIAGFIGGWIGTDK